MRDRLPPQRSARGRWSRRLLPVLVVVALASASLPAFALGDAATDQYTEPLPNGTGGTAQGPTLKAPAGGAGQSKTQNQGSGSAQAPSSTPAPVAPPPPPSAGTGEASSTGGSKAPDRNKGKGGKKHPKTKTRAKPGDEGKQAAAAPVSTSGGDGGGSAPVLPIVLGVLVLAAISFGVVLMRGRRKQEIGAQP